MLEIKNLADRKTIAEILDRRFLDDNFETPLKKGYSTVLETTKTPMPESKLLIFNNKKDFHVNIESSNSNSNIRAFPVQALLQNSSKPMAGICGSKNCSSSVLEDSYERDESLSDCLPRDGKNIRWIIPSFKGTDLCIA